MNENYLNQYIEELNQSISSNFKLIEFEFLNGYYGDTRLNPVRDEICKCIICNLGQAALTLTNHLLELALKNCLIRKYLKDNKDTLSENISDAFQQGIEKYDSQKMNDTINYAYDEGLLTEVQKTTLHTYRKKFRNAWGMRKGIKYLKVKLLILDLSVSIKEITFKLSWRIFSRIPAENNFR